MCDRQLIGNRCKMGKKFGKYQPALPVSGEFPRRASGVERLADKREIAIFGYLRWTRLIVTFDQFRFFFK